MRSNRRYLNRRLESGAKPERIRLALRGTLDHLLGTIPLSRKGLADNFTFMVANTEELWFTAGASRVSALATIPSAPVAGFVLAHGAGAGMRHRFLAAVAEALAGRGIAVLRYQFPYLEEGRGRPDTAAVATRTVEVAVRFARDRWPGLPLVAGGKSFGGRMTSTAASLGFLADIRGIVFFGFPLHPPKKPAVTRAEHLDQVAQPMLFLQGTRDDLADLTLIRQVTDRLGSRATLHVVLGADHSFAVLKSSGRGTADVMAELIDTASAWITGVSSPGSPGS